MSGLPFTSAIWVELPASLTKLILDLGHPVRVDHEGDVIHRSYITSNEMRPLQEQTQLKELRLFNVHNSFQPIIWETVFRNTSPGAMGILEIQMAVPPIVRSGQWKKANDVMGLTVPKEESSDKHYKGLDGKGILHYSVGTGEYLDSLCIRLARIGSGLDESTPLPLWGLKLDGFVLDHLPFEHELSRIVYLECGDNCIDSGLRAPKTQKAPHNKWSKTINNATSHCLIKWPNWTGIFDAGGHQRNKSGEIVPQEIGLSTPINEYAPSPVVPLIEESLNMKALDDALMSSTETDYFTGSPVLPRPSANQIPVDAASNISVRGSEVPTPTVASSKTANSPTISAVGGADVAVMTSFAGLEVAGAEEVMELADVPDLDHSSVPTSACSSFGGEYTSASDIASNVATAGSSTPAMDEEEFVSTIEQKVRASLYMVSGFAS
ncbi:hypothetical protein FB567DRAFT_502503 [Paraphoma chrysanthemicola]|uniref:Uncharacterized protein n=1 Tax=Paraphoma chrysanthemicola TaxID=798071 RepID=A0A8K0QYY5_9PLEO|nr:hypothetical protein FB567DRAFT_502503 [Paraphoma chrysanthemicola]